MRIDLKPYLAQRSQSCVYAVYSVPMVPTESEMKRPGLLSRILDGVELALTVAAGAGMLWVLAAIISAV